jgi:TRAP-type mannitol/chloroaromatic compound transport system permease small subunit
MVLVQFCIVIGRYVFGVNSIAAQESVLYMHATLFMLGAGYTLLVDKHVRVDVFLCQAGRPRVGGASISSATCSC